MWHSGHAESCGFDSETKLATCPGCHPAFTLRWLIEGSPRDPVEAKAAIENGCLDFLNAFNLVQPCVLASSGKGQGQTQCCCPAGATTMLDVLHPAEISKTNWTSVAGREDTDGKTKTRLGTLLTCVIVFICVLINSRRGGWGGR